MGTEELLARIEADTGLRRVLEVAREREDPDPGHDVAHALRVALWTLRLAEGGVDFREAVAAALLHDVVNVPKNSPERAQASSLSAAFAAELLPGAGFGAEAVTRVTEAIRDHSYSRGAVPTGALGRALQDADRLEALGALGILRTASTGALMGAEYFDAADPWAQHRELNDLRFTVDHFFRKLLRLEGTLLTPAGREEAHRRTEFMRAFLRQLGSEIGAPQP
jgi:uncharacterized protein